MKLLALSRVLEAPVHSLALGHKGRVAASVSYTHLTLPTSDLV